MKFLNFDNFLRKIRSIIFAQSQRIPENPWNSLIWLTLVLRNGLPEYREKSQDFRINVENTILLSGVLEALNLALRETGLVDKSFPLVIENQNRLIIYMIFHGSVTYTFVTSLNNKFALKPYSNLFIKSYEKYQAFGGVSEDD
jgi:hypothetical protein